jgi:hypothetical protein
MDTDLPQVLLLNLWQLNQILSSYLLHFWTAKRHRETKILVKRVYIQSKFKDSHKSIYINEIIPIYVYIVYSVKSLMKAVKLEILLKIEK